MVSPPPLAYFLLVTVCSKGTWEYPTGSSLAQLLSPLALSVVLLHNQIGGCRCGFWGTLILLVAYSSNSPLWGWKQIGPNKLFSSYQFKLNCCCTWHFLEEDANVNTQFSLRYSTDINQLVVPRVVGLKVHSKCLEKNKKHDYLIGFTKQTLHLIMW